MNQIKITALVLMVSLSFYRTNCQTTSYEGYKLINQILKTNHITLLDIHANCINGLLSGDSIVINPKDFTIFDIKERLSTSNRVIDTLFNAENLKYIKKQLNDCKHDRYWNKDSLPEFTQLYKLKKFTPLLPRSLNIKRNTPPRPLTSFSMPVFNKEMNVAFVEQGLYFGFSSGSSDLIIYIKQNNIWVEYAVHQLWMM